MLRKMTTFLFISLSYPGMVYSLPTSSSGLIHFQGAIVDPPCQFNWEEEHIEMACWYDGEQLKQEKVIEYKKREQVSIIHRKEYWNKRS
ncbi:type 1 fimbrial protein [Xenorhabdus nematophila]|uniref:type 1 fimbrial protein n=1 Tax=Xenorhabdus nematophila TaxID=628 RepID=UPI000A86609B|nr:type 1 fimbrial protein [Xenorhabdus nematophila]